MSSLAQQRCTPLEGGQPLSTAELTARLPEVPGWALSGEFIEKTFSFGNYHETMAFMNALAWICHQEDHHPEVLLTYNRCVVRFNTHSVNGISVNDLICAAKANALLNAAA
jgi:4a-hydroxytetrahydrobiopterin dehydratase